MFLIKPLYHVTVLDNIVDKCEQCQYKTLSSPVFIDDETSGSFLTPVSEFHTISAYYNNRRIRSKYIYGVFINCHIITMQTKRRSRLSILQEKDHSDHGAEKEVIIRKILRNIFDVLYTKFF